MHRHFIKIIFQNPEYEDYHCNMSKLIKKFLLTYTMFEFLDGNSFSQRSRK